MASDTNWGALRLVTPSREAVPLRAAHMAGDWLQNGASPAKYYRHIESFAQKIRETRDVHDIIGILDEALSETRALHNANDIAIVRQQVERAEQRIQQLMAELEVMNQLVHEDKLTRALNRRGLDEAVKSEAARATRAGTPLCIAMIDIDNFKTINDTHGHQVGDIVLVHLAAVIKATIRANDLIGRYGGEEFLLLLPDARLDEASAVMSRLQRAFVDKPVSWAMQELLVTFSAGIARYSAGETVEAFIKRADHAQYEAKRMGKNRVIVAA